MEDLYNELWRKKLPVIQDRTFSIPRPQQLDFRLGYKADLKEVDKAFPDPEFEKGKEEKVFKVLEVKSELPCGGNRLLVRPEFVAIEEDLFRVESNKSGNILSETKIRDVSLQLDFRIAGQPGSGKSFFLSYLLVCRLMAGQPTAFRNNDSDCYLFDSICHGHETDANFLFHLPENRKKTLWILTDEALVDARWKKKNHDWFVVLAASPAKLEASKQWKKDRNAGVRYMTNWGWDEIVAAFCLASSEPPTPHQIAMLFTTFTCFGPIARTCLQSITVRNYCEYARSLDQYIGEVDKEIDTFVAQGGYQTIENSVHQHASHRIAIMHPTDNRCSYNAGIATRWIAHKVFEKVQMKSRLRCFELYNQLACQSSLRTAAGWIFEAYAHDWFRKGGSFEAWSLPIKENETQPLKFTTYRSQSLNYFTDARSLATLVRVKGDQRIKEDVVGKYFLPYNANFESVDGLVFSALDTLILLQITIAKSHHIKPRGVQRLCESLPAFIKNIHIVFVIPEDCISKYLRVQRVPKARDVKPESKDLTITQFRLVLTEEIMQSMAVDSQFEMQDRDRGEDESGSEDYDGEDMAMGGTQ